MRAAVVATAMCLSTVGFTATSEIEAAIRRSTNISSQGLGPALKVLAKEHGFQLVYRTEFVRHLRTLGAVGQMTTEEALSQLLNGTGLTYHRIDEKTITIVPLLSSGAASVVDSEKKGSSRGTFASFLHSPQVDPNATSGSLSVEESSGSPDSRRRDASMEVEEIVVTATGTRIRGAHTSASPSYTFDREDFAQAGATSVQQMIRTLPQVFTGGNTETGSALASARNGGDGNVSFGAGINLRGLGDGSTLVLLNGRRMAPGGFGSFVDVSNIPLSAIERIDVLPDGASAIYGSDAVGGVVNFILRDNFHGAETAVRYGRVTDGGLREFGASQLAGAAWGTGSILLNVDYGRREPLLSSERAYASALTKGLTYLTPDQERLGALVSGHQELNSTLSVSALLYANARDAQVETFMPLQLRQLSADGTTDQIGGTLALTWDASDAWSVTLAYTDSRSDNDRVNLSGASATAPVTKTSLRVEQEMQAFELEAEGAIFPTPGGVARLAVGGERRDEYQKDVRMPAPTSPRGEATFGRTVKSAYAELLVPVVGDRNEVSGVRRVDLTAAVRYEEYDDMGSSDNWKFGAVWSPIRGLNLRATHGTSYRAPYLYQFQTGLGFAMLFEAPNSAEPDGTTLVAAISQIADPDLGPENATIWTAGFDVDPSILGLRVSATYFSIDYEDRIAAALLSRTPFGNPSLAGLISMPPDPDIIAQIGTLDPSQIYRYPGTTAPISAVQATYDGRTRNQARTEVSGVDLIVERSFATRAARVDLGVSASYLFAFETQQTISVAPVVDIVDTVFNPVDLRARTYAVLSHESWSLSAFLNYIDSYTDNQIETAPVSVSSWKTVDLGISHQFSDTAGWLQGVTLRANAINAFNARPPAILDRKAAWGNPGFDTENANPLGRVLSIQVTKSW